MNTNVPVQPQSSTPQTTQKTSLPKRNAVNTNLNLSSDPFFQIIQNMINSNLMQQNENSELPKEASEMAAMMNIIPENITADNLLSNEQTQVLNVNGISENLKNNNIPIQTLNQNVDNAVLSDTDISDINQVLNNMQLLNSDKDVSNKDTKEQSNINFNIDNIEKDDISTKDIKLDVESLVLENKNTKEQSLFNIQQKFRLAVDKTKNDIISNNSDDADNLDEFDADSLQKQISVLDRKDFMIHNEKTLSEAQTRKEIITQTANGIKENIKLSKNEFVIKLNPKELGEITVKLTEKEGKMLLSITTANANTAKIINQEISSLQDAMKPMNVEVKQAVHDINESANSNNFTFTEHGFGQNSGSQTYHNREDLPQYYVDLSENDANVSNEEQQKIIDGVMDEYV